MPWINSCCWLSSYSSIIRFAVLRSFFLLSGVILKCNLTLLFGWLEGHLASNPTYHNSVVVPVTLLVKWQEKIVLAVVYKTFDLFVASFSMQLLSRGWNLISPVVLLFRPRLGPIASKVAVVGVVYFIMSSVEGFMRASVVSRVTVVLWKSILLSLNMDDNAF